MARPLPDSSLHHTLGSCWSRMTSNPRPARRTRLRVPETCLLSTSRVRSCNPTARSDWETRRSVRTLASPQAGSRWRPSMISTPRRISGGLSEAPEACRSHGCGPRASLPPVPMQAQAARHLAYRIGQRHMYGTRRPSGGIAPRTATKLKYQDPFSGLIRLHILHYAAEGEFYGQWMIHELARHGYTLSPGSTVWSAEAASNHEANDWGVRLAGSIAPQRSVERPAGWRESKCVNLSAN